MIPYRLRPSFGFLYLVLVLAGALAFFGWGLAQPKLDRVAEMLSLLQTGHRDPLSADERALLQDILLRYPELGQSLVENRPSGIFSKNENGRVDEKYAYLIRLTPQDPHFLQVRYAGTSALGRVRVSAWAQGEEQQGEAGPGQNFLWTLPQSGPYPQLVELRFKGQKVKKGNEPPAAVRISLEPAP